MSLDIYLSRQRQISYDNGETFTEDEEDLFNCNITHNLGAMAEEAGIYKALWGHEEVKTARELLDKIISGVHTMELEPERFKKFDASNGWGTYDDFMPWLYRLIEKLREYPNAKVYISR